MAGRTAWVGRRLAPVAALTGIILSCFPASGQNASWAQLTATARQFYQQGKYEQASAAAQQAVRAAGAAFGPESHQAAVSLNDLAMALKALDRLADAEPLYRRAIAIEQKVLGPASSEVAASLSNLGELYRKMGRLAEARDLLKQALNVQEKALGPNDAAIAITVHNLAAVSFAQGQYAEAEALERRALAINEKALGPDDAGVADDLNAVGDDCHRQGKHAEAESLYAKALAIHLKLSGKDSNQVAVDLNKLAVLYADEKRYALAEATYRRALATLEKGLGPDNPQVAAVLSNLATLYQNEARYDEAEQAYRRTLTIRQKAGSSLVAATLVNLAQIRMHQGQMPEAEAMYKQALAIAEKALGPNDLQVATLLHGLGKLYLNAVQVPAAVPLLRRALAIHEKALGPAHPDVAADLFELAVVYDAGGKVDESAPLYERIIAMEEKAFGPSDFRLADPLLALATVRQRLGKFSDAEPLGKRALAILEASKGPDHPDTRAALANLAITYYGSGRTELAATYFDRDLVNLTRQADSNVSYMNERQRLQFLGLAPGALPLFFSFAIANRNRDPSLANKMYDALLWERGLVASNAAALRAKILDSGDRQAVELFDKLTAKRSELAVVASTPAGDAARWRRTMQQLDQEANAIETDLVKRSAALADAKALSRFTWRDVQKSLKADEAAVEYVRFPVHDGGGWITNGYGYSAVVLTPTAAPKMVWLGNAEKLEAEPVAAYRAGMQRTRGILIASKTGAGQAAGSGSSAAYTAFWKSVEETLGGARRVYVAADGILNQVPIGLFSDPAGNLLLEKYDLRMVNSTKDLLRPQRGGNTKTAVVIGNPAFDLSAAAQRQALSKLNTGAAIGSAAPPAESAPAWRGDERAGALPPLPATQAEVNAIGQALKNAGWQVSLYTGNLALEEVLGRVRSPRVVHLATHGFFLANSATEKTAASAAQTVPGDPMLRSGLFFAGADRTRAGEGPAADLDDGVLTAYEATQLHLQGTELVVLSACETGLGQQANGEGVFGLRRGLQEAGAEKVLMSMWPVPDRETQELMTLFYQQWLGGLDAHEALRRAQLKERETVKQRYGRDLPYYWGAFVLVGR